MNHSIYTRGLLSVVANICLYCFSASSQQLTLVDNNSEVKFTVTNFGFDVDGTLGGLKGTITFDSSKPETSLFDVSVDVNSIRTGNATRDRHLKQEDFFHTEKYPAITFVSTAITKIKNSFMVTGLLTIKGIKKTISFPFSVQHENNAIVFIGTFSIDRKDFNIGGGITVSRNVDVGLRVLAR